MTAVSELLSSADVTLASTASGRRGERTHPSEALSQRLGHPRGDDAVMAVLSPPVPVMAASARGTLPDSDQFAFEPKLDGWRALCFAAGGAIQSRHGTNLTYRFPMIAGHVQNHCGDVVLDGELVAYRGGRLDFSALNYGPARRRAENVTIFYVAFDLLAVHDQDLRSQPYAVRRARLERLLSAPEPPLQLVPSTTERLAALEWMSLELAVVGIEGVVAKPVQSPYRSGRRADWIKVRHRVVVELVVVGVVGKLQDPGALVLARPGRRERLVGVSLPLPSPVRRELAGKLESRGPRQELPPLVGGLPGGQQSPPTCYQPIAPLPVEVSTDAAIEHGRLRHRPRVLRVAS